MSNVLVEKDKLDILATAISNKSGEPLKLTLDEMVSAVDGIKTEANLQEKQYSVNKAGQELIQADSGYDGLSNVIVNTPSGSVTGPTSTYYATMASGWGNNNGTLRVKVDNIPTTPSVSAGYVSSANSSSRSVYVPTTIPYKPTVTVSGNTVTIPNGYYPLQQAETVPSISTYSEGIAYYYTTENGQRKWKANAYFRETAGVGGFIEAYSNYESEYQNFNAIPTNTSVTPTESAQTIGGANTMMEGAVTVSAIPSNYVGSGITQRSSTDLTVSGATVTVPSGYYSAQASKSVASGTAGTPTATKGTVSNHSVSVTPSVTNTTGYITGGTKTGTAVTVSASELVSGTETKTENGTYDVTNLASVVVNVSGSSSVQTGIGQAVTGTNDSLIFAVLGNPTSFSLIYTGDITIGETPIVSAIAFDGTDYVGQIVTNTANAQASYISTGFSHTYYSSEQGIQINSTDAVFSTYSNYKLVYTYGGSSSDIHTANVQVGSGATSITFPSLSGRPIYWSCVFKSNFSTSSGYQRVIATGNDGSSTYGMCLDSSAHASSSYWTASYSGGSLTISSQGTNQGGYFHQPGYYQLTYAVDDSAPEYQTKTVTPTTSQQIVTPDSGYDALSQVTVNAIPSQYIIPSGNLPITANGNNINVSQYATVSVNVPTGGGSSMNAQSAQSTTRSTSTTYTECISLICDTSGTYDVYWSTFRSSTSGTWGSQLYLGNTAYGSAQTGSWSNHIQNIHLTNVQIDANEEVSVRVRSRGSSYYGYVGTLTIIQTS